MTARGKLSNLGAETNDLYPSKPSSTVINIISRIGIIMSKLKKIKIICVN